MDLDFARTTKQLFLVLHGGKVFIAVNGLSFADIIFVDDFSDPFAGVAEYQLVVDRDYTMPAFLQDMSVAVLASQASQNLADQLSVVSSEGEGKIDLSAKLYYKTTYKDGSLCDLNNQPRQTHVVYYCDQHSKRRELRIIDISEPDFCTYQITLATKYLCNAGS